MSQQSPESPGSEPYQPTQQHYGQQVPDGYRAPDQYQWEQSSGPQGYDQQGYAPQREVPQGWSVPPQPPLSEQDEKLWAVLAHLSIPFFAFLGPLVVYAIFRDRSPWLRQSSAEALNFSLLYTVAQTVSSMLVVVLIGAALVPLVFLAGLVLCILGALASSRHESYRYPANVRLVT